MHDLSRLTALEALRLVTEAESSVCVRLYRRSDGKVQTTDCTTGTERSRRRLRVLGAGAVLGGAAAVAVAAWPEPPVDPHHTCAAPADHAFDETTFLYGHPPATTPSPEDTGEWRGQLIAPDDAVIRELFEGISDYTEDTSKAPDED